MPAYLFIPCLEKRIWACDGDCGSLPAGASGEAHTLPLKVDLANVRTHLQRGEGGALSPTVLHASDHATPVSATDEGPFPHMSGSEAELSDGDDTHAPLHEDCAQPGSQDAPSVQSG